MHWAELTVLVIQWKLWALSPLIVGDESSLPLEYPSPGAVVKAVCLERRGSRIRTLPWHSSFEEIKCFSPLTRKYCGEHPRPRRACSASDRWARISNYVSGGQCLLIHLAILRRFSWPSLALMYTEVA